MVKRLFFDGVDILSNKVTIGMGIERSASVFPDIADTKFPVRDQAVVAAQETGNLLLFRFLIKQSFFLHDDGLSSKRHKGSFGLYHIPQIETYWMGLKIQCILQQNTGLSLYVFLYSSCMLIPRFSRVET